MSECRPASPATLRRRVFQRDQGKCALCGLDAADLRAALDGEWQRVKLAHTPQERRERTAFRQQYRWFFRRASCWDADHIVPLVEGGAHSLENLRTLCVPCHQRVTRDLAKRRSARQRRERRGQHGIVLDFLH